MKSSLDKAQASPTNQFSLSMPTFDISLAKAMLGLVDNCLDDVLRLADVEDVEGAKHSMQIEIAEVYFAIADNRGGFPRDVAKNCAFEMSLESDDDRDWDTETIGTYGSETKRAAFKMGRDVFVRTKHGKVSFEMPIKSEWLDTKNWDPLPNHEPPRRTRSKMSLAREYYVSELYEGLRAHGTAGQRGTTHDSLC